MPKAKTYTEAVREVRRLAHNEYCRADYRANKKEHNTARQARNRVNPGPQIARGIARRDAGRAAAYAEFRTRGGKCEQCGYVGVYACYDWAHKTRDDKYKGVSELYQSGAAKVIAELAKCTLLCVICHRVETTIENGWYHTIFMASDEP